MLVADTTFPVPVNSPLSFHDSFKIISGVPVLILDPSRYTICNLPPQPAAPVAKSPLAPRRPQRMSTPGEVVPVSDTPSGPDVTSMKFNFDGSRLVSGHGDGSLRVWDGRHGKLLADLQGSEGLHISDCCFQPGSGDRVVLSCNENGEFGVWSVVQGKRTWFHKCIDNVVKYAGADLQVMEKPKFSQDGSLLVVPICDPDSQYAVLLVYDTSNNERALDWKFQLQFDPSDWYFSYDSRATVEPIVDISVDSHGLFVGPIGLDEIDGSYVALWPDLTPPDELQGRLGPDGSYRLRGRHGRWSHCSDWFATWDPLNEEEKTEVLLWKLSSITTLCTQLDPPSSFSAQTIHPRWKTEETVKLKDPYGYAIDQIEFVGSCDFTRLVSCSKYHSDLRMLLWDVEKQVPLNKMDRILNLGKSLPIEEQVYQLQSPSDGSWLILGHPDRSIIWDARYPHMVEILRLVHPEGLRGTPSVVLSADCYKLAIQGERGKLIVWDTRAANRDECSFHGADKVKLPVPKELQCRGKGVGKGHRFSCRGEKFGLVLTYLHLTNIYVLIWDLAVGRVRWLDMDGTSPTDFCVFNFSQDASRLVTCSAKGLQIWDLSSMPTSKTVNLSNLLWSFDLSCVKCQMPAIDVTFSSDLDESEELVLVDGNGDLHWFNLNRQAHSKVESKQAEAALASRFVSNGSKCAVLHGKRPAFASASRNARRERSNISVESIPEIGHIDDVTVVMWDIIKRAPWRKVTFCMETDNPRQFLAQLSMQGVYAVNRIDKQVFTPVIQRPRTTADENLNIQGLRTWPQSAAMDVCYVSEDGQYAVTEGTFTATWKQSQGETPASSGSIGVQASKMLQLYAVKAGNRVKSRRQLTAQTVEPGLWIISLDGSAEPKKVWYGIVDWEKTGSTQARMLALSGDGRRLAVGEDEYVTVLTPYATYGAIPIYGVLKAHNLTLENDVLEWLLHEYNANVFNYPDHQGWSILMHAINDQNVRWVKTMLQWARDQNIKVWIRTRVAHAGGTVSDINGLSLAIERRAPECIKALLDGLFNGVAPHLGVAHVFETSLMRLSVVYRSIFRSITSDPRMLLDLGEVLIPEDAFGTQSFLTTTTDRLWYCPHELQCLWSQNPKVASFGHEGSVHVNAVSKVVLYASIAQVGMKGILRPLLVKRAPHHMYATMPVRCVISYKWDLYSEKMIWWDFLLYCGLLVSFSIHCILLGNNSEKFDMQCFTDWKSLVSLFFLFASIILAFMNLIGELRQVCTYWIDGRNHGFNGLIHWARVNVWNVWEMASYLLVVFAIPIAHFGTIIEEEKEQSQYALSCLVAITTIMLWWKLLYYGKCFPSTAPLVIMVFQIIKDIASFLLLLVAILAGFGLAFFVLFRQDTSCCMNPNCEHYNGDCHDLMASFGSFGHALVTMFGMMLGGFDLDVFYGSPLAGLAVTLFVLYQMTMMVVLLNLLIAIMGDRWEDVHVIGQCFVDFV